MTAAVVDHALSWGQGITLGDINIRAKRRKFFRGCRYKYAPAVRNLRERPRQLNGVIAYDLWTGYGLQV